MAAEPIRWGVIATGNIADVFTRELALLPDHQVVAVGSRSRERAEEFARSHPGRDGRIARAYGSYTEVADDPEVDVVYVATPHSDHYATSRYALEAGKAVLCEKAFTVDARQARDLVDLARSKQRFLMEAMWMRCNPLHRRLRELVHSGAIGEPRWLRAELGFVADFDPADRLFAPDLAGGALLDVGVYPISLAYHLFGSPSAVQARATFAPTGVDATISTVLAYDSIDTIATLTGSLTAELPDTAVIAGTEGWIELPEGFQFTNRLTINRPNHEPELVEVELLGVGYVYEAEEVATGLRAGALESPLVTHADTIAVMDLMDEVRRQVGIRYPSDAM